MEQTRTMLRALISSASRLLEELRRAWLVPAASARPGVAGAVPVAPCSPLERVVLTDGVGRALFEEYARHRAAARGEEETGWVLLGLREPREAIALATLPAGTLRDASVSHVRFNSTAQAVASRIVRQDDRRLSILGVVHTHPGSLRHPSDGDLRGDRLWVGHLRGQEGVFGIGTADAANVSLYSLQPRPNVQCLGELRFSWYSLRQGTAAYRPLPVGMALGPDLARRLRAAWPTLETHAERIERLFLQQANLRIEVVEDKPPGLVLVLPLAGEGNALRVVLCETTVRYLVQRKGELFEVDHHDELVDRGTYRLLAQLAQEA
jgi:proteasome lid subunit RPN8/RPN11